MVGWNGGEVEWWGGGVWGGSGRFQTRQLLHVWQATGSSRPNHKKRPEMQNWLPSKYLIESSYCNEIHCPLLCPCHFMLIHYSGCGLDIECGVILS